MLYLMTWGGCSRLSYGEGVAECRWRPVSVGSPALQGCVLQPAVCLNGCAKTVTLVIRIIMP